MGGAFPFSRISTWSQTRDFCSHLADGEREVIRKDELALIKQEQKNQMLGTQESPNMPLLSWSY